MHHSQSIPLSLSYHLLVLTGSFRVFFVLLLFNDFRNSGNMRPHFATESLHIFKLTRGTRIDQQRCSARGRLRVITSSSNSFLLTNLRNILQFVTKCIFFSAAVPAWTACLPDHRWLDSDQQYHFVKINTLCNYHYMYEEAIMVYLTTVVLQRQFMEQF